LPAAPTLTELRAYAIGRSLFAPTTLGRAIARLGFVQADPIRAPARAQDLTLRHRVTNYRAGDLEKRYARLGIEEDFFVNYGYLPRATQALMHPRTPRQPLTAQEKKQAPALIEFVRQHGPVHPRDADAHFAHGTALNWFGGQSNVTTKLLDTLHYHGHLRVARRDAGTRVYAVRDAAATGKPAQGQGTEAAASGALDALVDVIVRKYAPLPAASLGQLVSHLMVGVPQWKSQRNTALLRAKSRLAHASMAGVDWYWPAHEKPHQTEHPRDQARLLAPFDPVVWDRRRFKLFWGWDYRFEAYTPAPKRKLGYYALPLLWRDEVIGWGNAAVAEGALHVALGLCPGHRATAALRSALDAEIASLAEFLGASACGWSWIKP
jgi:uncharacterized protein YcaQ